jgi:hypothetical protein
MADTQRFNKTVDSRADRPTGPSTELRKLIQQDGPVALDEVLCTGELYKRPCRAADYQKQCEVLLALVEALARSPRNILQVLADTMLDLFQSHSAGVSFVTGDGKWFYWPAIAGAWRPHIGGGTPRDFGPCGDVLDRNEPLLFKQFQLRYEYFKAVSPVIHEALLVPFYVDGKAVGTAWTVMHDDLPKGRKYDLEDLRLLKDLAGFASAAYQASGWVEKYSRLVPKIGRTSKA